MTSGGVMRWGNHTYREKRYLVSNRCRLLIFPKLRSAYCWLNTFPQAMQKDCGGQLRKRFLHSQSLGTPRMQSIT